MHLGIFILVINQLDAQYLFYKKFISCLYMFRASCAHRQGSKLYYTASGIITLCRWPSGAQVERGLFPSQPMHRTATYRCDNTRGGIIRFCPPGDEHMLLETCRGMK